MIAFINQAQAVAVAEIADSFAVFHRRATQDGQRVEALLPDEFVIRELAGAAFWTSLRRDESTPSRISLAYLAPVHTRTTLHFERPIPLKPEILTRLAPGIGRAGIRLGVCYIEGKLQAWGVTLSVPPLSLVAEIVAPGAVMIRCRSDEAFGRFMNVALLEGDRVKVLDHGASTLPEWPRILKCFFPKAGDYSLAADTLIRLSLSMRAHGRGGSLLVVPVGSTVWRESISSHIPYLSDPPYSELAEIIRISSSSHSHEPLHERKERAIELVAGLTAIDGATVITEDFEVLAFGAKIIRRPGSHSLEQVAVSEPVRGTGVALVHPAFFGGARHLFAAQFVSDQPGAIALVASQNGPFTVFLGAEPDAPVHGYCVETLLL